jgi:hypothetical protein
MQAVTSPVASLRVEVLALFDACRFMSRPVDHRALVRQRPGIIKLVQVIARRLDDGRDGLEVNPVFLSYAPFPILGSVPARRRVMLALCFQ